MPRISLPRVSLPIALTGPAAAVLYRLDGFRDVVFPHRYTSPYGAHGRPGIIRTRHWRTPEVVNGELLAPISLVLRHLNAFPADLKGLPDKISPQDRVELATEHARRLGHAVVIPHNSQTSGDQMLRAARRLSGCEPPTESYAETRALQWFRSQQLHPWRQLPIRIGGKDYRMDFGLSLGPRYRLDRIRPSDLLICHVDSREYHEGTFELDYRKRNAFDRAGYHHIELTPNEITHHSQRALATILGAIRRANGSHPRRVSLTPRPVSSQQRPKSLLA